MPSLMGLDSVEVILDGLDESAELINSNIWQYLTELMFDMIKATKGGLQ